MSSRPEAGKQNGDEGLMFALGVDAENEPAPRAPVGVELAARRGVQTRPAPETFAGVEARGVPDLSGVRPRCRDASAPAPRALGVEAWRDAEDGDADVRAAACSPQPPCKEPAGTWMYWQVRRL